MHVAILLIVSVYHSYTPQYTPWGFDCVSQSL